MPRIVRKQRWSLLNVPLMWTAAGHPASTRVLEWLCETTASFPPLQFNGGSLEIQGAARMEWTSLRAAMKTWSIAQPEDLSICLRNHGFPGPQVGSHISARAQECMLSERCRHDARVEMLEAVHITTTLKLGRKMVPVEEPREAREEARFPRVAPHPTHSTMVCSWADLDDVDMEEVFTQRVPMLGSCPHFFRGCFRNSFRAVLEERYRADHEGDELAEERTWKLFALVPMMFLHRAQGTGGVGRDELASRDDLFTKGRWRELIDAALRVEVPTPGKREVLTEDQ